MAGRFCSVTPFDIQADIHPLFEAFSADTEDRIWTYLPYGPFASVRAMTEWAERTCRGDDPMFHTIRDATGHPVGLASYLRIDPGNGSVEVGHINFAPALQRTPAATEAMFLMMCRVFDTLGYRRYEWKCDSLNAGSVRAANRLGFQYEGTFRQATHYKGRNRDTAWFSIIDKDWPAVKAAFVAWLDPSNFDADGQQRQRLGVPKVAG
jgi:RimJ/RimL family protein N-acetyltransferase